MSALLVSLGRTMLHGTEQSSICHQVVETEDGMALMIPIGDLVDVNYPDRSATTILAGGSGERI
jgi:hypothetical protein